MKFDRMSDAEQHEVLVDLYLDMHQAEGKPALIEVANQYQRASAHPCATQHARDYSRRHLDAIRGALRMVKIGQMTDDQLLAALAA